MFLDESAEWEDESTLNTPSKQTLQTYFPDVNDTPHQKQSVLHILQSQPPNSQLSVSESQPGQSAVSKSQSSQSQSNEANPQRSRDMGRTHREEGAANDEEDVPQSQLLQKLFPSVSISAATCSDEQVCASWLVVSCVILETCHVSNMTQWQQEPLQLHS